MSLDQSVLFCPIHLRLYFFWEARIAVFLSILQKSDNIAFDELVYKLIADFKTQHIRSVHLHVQLFENVIMEFDLWRMRRDCRRWKMSGNKKVWPGFSV